MSSLFLGRKQTNYEYTGNSGESSLLFIYKQLVNIPSSGMNVY